MIDCPLSATAANQPNDIAIVEDGRAITFLDLHRATSQLSAFLRNQGFRKGDRACFQLPNSWQTIALFYACFRNGIVATPISTRIPIASLGKIVESVQGRLFDLPKSISFERSDNTATSLDENIPATIIFSSGTTGTPKAVVHSLHAHLENARGSNENIILHPGDSWLLSLPLFHVGGLAIVFRSILAGATIIIDKSSKGFIDLIERDRVSHVSMVATQLKALLELRPEPPKHLTAVLLGGSALPRDMVRKARQNGFPLFTTYGLSEMASQVTTTPPDTPATKWQTAGKLLRNRELSISTSDEILVRGETLFKGYWQGEEINPSTDESGWFATNDRGHVDADGYLHVIGRCDNMFISGGENIHPEEIESLLLDVPEIIQAIVIAVPDSKFGQRPAAIVRAKDFDEAKVRQHLEQHLPRFKIPDQFYSWPNELQDLSIKPSRKTLENYFRKKE